MLAGKGINCVKLCPICKEQDESILHLLRDCVYARDLWRKLEVPLTQVSSFTEGFETWLKTNCLSGMKHKGTTPWCTFFIFMLWSLWKNRNHVVFENTIPNPRHDKVCLSQAKDYYYYISKAKQITPKIAIPVRWSKPILGWFKLNTDGASLGNPGKAGSGGLIRDSEGRWVKGFSRSVGHATSVIAELWDLRDGLKLAAQLGIGCLEVELDAKIIVEMLNNAESSNNTNLKFSSLLYGCRFLIANATQVRVTHIYKEMNQCADFLARKGCCLREDFVIFESSPSEELDKLLVADVNGLYCSRQIATTLASITGL